MAKQKTKHKDLLHVSTVKHTNDYTFLSVDLQWVSFMLHWSGFLMQTDKRLLVFSPFDREHKFVYRVTDGH